MCQVHLLPNLRKQQRSIRIGWLQDHSGIRACERLALLPHCFQTSREVEFGIRWQCWSPFSERHNRRLCTQRLAKNDYISIHALWIKQHMSILDYLVKMHIYFLHFLTNFSSSIKHKTWNKSFRLYFGKKTNLEGERSHSFLVLQLDPKLTLFLSVGRKGKRRIWKHLWDRFQLQLFS